MKSLAIISILFFGGTILSGQVTTRELTGRVSFISSENVYARFNTTDGINKGDTLYVIIAGVQKPALIVEELSSVSCVCKTFGSVRVSVDQIVIAVFVPTVPVVQAELKLAGDTAVNAARPADADISELSGDKESSGRILRGSIGINSYSDFSSGSTSPTRFRYTMNIVSENQSDTGLVVKAWISFRHKAGNPENIPSGLSESLKVYTLSASYGFSPSSKITAGRLVSTSITNIGAVDGVAYERNAGHFALGALAGSRPDGVDYGLNPRLFSYGGFVAYGIKTPAVSSGTSLAFMEQMNGGVTDRRFIYFQHSNTIFKNLYLFSSFELDIYTAAAITNFDRPALTSAYFAARYRLSRAITLNGSYDARRNVVYYETYRTTTDSLLNYGLRQGLRMGSTLRISQKMTLGLNTGYRFMESDPRPALNASAYFNYDQLPIAGISGSLSASWLRTGYMAGYFAGVSFTRDFQKGDLNTGIGYRFVDYLIEEPNIRIIQHTGEVSLSYRLPYRIYLSAYYEPMIDAGKTYHRVYMQIRKRF
ncbi:MAG: hypothetical protein IH591_17650 [Bacteroidales bacterium]|nr:hypothetical protein [Bacteroidales bacterium]